MGTVLAFASARDFCLKTTQQYAQSVVYMSEDAHPCNDRGINVVGLGLCQHRTVPLNSDHRMNVRKLAAIIGTDKQAGLLPFLVVAKFSGDNLSDNLAEIAELAKQQGVWFHVDASYGGYLLLDESVKQRCKGIENADSVTLDCHKGMSAPLETSVVLLRKGSHLKEAMKRRRAPYLVESSSAASYSPFDYSFEYSRPFRAFPVWFLLKMLGTEVVKTEVTEKLKLTQYAYDSLKHLTNVEMFGKPDLTIVAFRYIPSNSKNGNDMTQKWLELILKEDKVYLTSAWSEGLFYIRLCFLSFRCHIEHVEVALDSIRHSLSKLQETEC